ncbi:MAG: OmpA family protein [Deltaproteobacteria bacterium]|nr:OmpA family protein [Deltaproteobacteria bacterium]
MLKRMVSIMLFLLLMAPAASARTINEIDLPETLTYDNITLGLNGGGTRVAFFNDVYVAGIYLQEAMTDQDKIINADEPMAIRMHIKNDFFASSKHVTKALHKGFRGSMPKGDITPIKNEVDRFNACFADKITDDEEFDIVYIPNKGTAVYKDGVLKDNIPGYDFKKAVFAIWLGKRPADKKLKKGMLAGDFRVAISKITVAKAAQEAKAKAEAAAKTKAAEAAKIAAAEQAKAEEAAAAMKAAQEAKAKAEVAAKAQEAARMKAMAQAKAREKAKVAAEAEKRAAQAMALEAQAKKAALAPKPAPKPATVASSATSVTEAQVVGEDLLFGFNSAKLSAKAEKLLARKVEWLKANPDKKVTIQVFCDTSGSRVYNEYLAGKRAKSVVKGLAAAGISKDRIEVLGFEFAKSRRAHFTVK